MRKHLKAAEYVTPGHPDRVADQIIATITNEIFKKDGFGCHSAIEVTLADNLCLVSGEAKTTLDISAEGLKPFVWEAIKKCGYNDGLRKRFSKEDVYIYSDFTIESKVHQQSPDIAVGVTEGKGWNDQGVCASGACAGHPTLMPLEHAMAKEIGDLLFKHSFKDDSPFGPDIKVLVCMEKEGDDYKFIRSITIAVPTIRDGEDGTWLSRAKDMVETYIFENYKKYIDMEKPIEWLINGTGVYHKHFSGADSSQGGRKIVVNQTGLNFPVGGGALGKNYFNQNFDLYGTLFSRWVARNIVSLNPDLIKKCKVEVSATIGKKKLNSIYIETGNDAFDSLMEGFVSKMVQTTPEAIQGHFLIPERKNFDEVAINNFLGGNPDMMAWEKNDLADEIKKYMNIDSILGMVSSSKAPKALSNIDFSQVNLGIIDGSVNLPEDSSPEVISRDLFASFLLFPKKVLEAIKEKRKDYDECVEQFKKQYVRVFGEDEFVLKNFDKLVSK